MIRTVAPPRILLNKGILLDCPFAHELVDLFCIWKLLLLKTLLPSVLVYLYAAPVLLETIFSNTHILLGKVPHPGYDLSDYIKSSEGKLLTSCLTDLGLLYTSLAPPCKLSLELLRCCNLCSNKRSGFVVPAVTTYAMEQDELLILLMIIFPKALLRPLLTLAASETYPYTL